MEVTTMSASGVSRALFLGTTVETSLSVSSKNMQACPSSNSLDAKRSLLGLRLKKRSATQMVPPRCAPSAGAGEGDRQPLETFLKLYTAVKEGNVLEASELIAEGCSSARGYVPFFWPLQAKKSALRLFSSLMDLLGNNVEFVIRPTMHEGTDMGVAWRLDWKKTHKPLGRGYTFHTVHNYQGKMYLRNVEKFFEPIIHIDSRILKLMESLRSNFDQIPAACIFKEKRRAGFMSLLVLLLLMACAFMVVKTFPF